MRASVCNPVTLNMQRIDFDVWATMTYEQKKWREKRTRTKFNCEIFELCEIKIQQVFDDSINFKNQHH